MTDAISYRAVTDVADMEAASHLEALIWGWDAQFASPTNVMRVTALKGGLVLCAYHHDEMVGMSWALPAVAEGKLILWSHVAGILPVYRRLGIGAGIKWAQREWALANGYTQIRWTFDPMQAGNANFNIRRLGATTYKIMENVYGVYDDALNPGLPTDRFETVWKLDAPQVIALAQGAEPAKNELPAVTLLEYDGQRLHRGMFIGKPSMRVEIPVNFSQIGRENPTLARDWQVALRETLADAFERQYAVTDFIRADGRCWYVISR